MALSPDLAVDVPLDVIETTVLAAVRITAFLVVAPPFANKGVPGPVKVALGLGLALVVQARLPRVATTSVAPLIGDVALQALVGLALGFLVWLVFAAVQSAGGLIDLFGGFQLATAFDPMNMVSGATFARLYQMLVVALLVASDAHHVMLLGLVRSFDSLPIGMGLAPAALAQAAISGLTGMTVSALQIAGPLIVVLFLADVGLGLLTRVAPALNAFAMGFPLKILLTVSLGGYVVLTLPGVLAGLSGTATHLMQGVQP
ncbi:flagellar biosynthetic protein FliR [Cellulomonas sp. SG140]|uniref:flagellar biosynthetic protein FliR n=1 Tax=Cellulomonas sp. SG140 TaxID=2976536 RepID=UPI0021E743A0|nr:flagellar biosynthetic protein FliR [Cellulomonas sp. SG140]